MNEEELRKLLAERAIEPVEPDPMTALQELEAARAHLESADRICDDDPSGAFAMSYDAMRKAISAHMRAQGYRATKGQGHHHRTGRYALAALADAGIEQDVDGLRRASAASQPIRV